MQLITLSDCVSRYGVTHKTGNNAHMSNSPVKIAKSISGLSGEELAAALGISAPHLSRLNTGKSKTNTDHIEKLAEICGISTEKFYALMSGDQSVAEDVTKTVTGTGSDQALLISSAVMDDALNEARDLDRKYAAGRAKSDNFKKLLFAIYTFIEAEKSES